MEFVEYGRKTLETKIADIKQREEALTLSKSFIISAPAGSGKTSLLIKRYMSALASSSPKEVLAITFTKKAAAEMRERLLTELKKPYEEMSDIAQHVTQKSKRHSWNILHHPEKIRICTIDSLCYDMAMLSEISSIENLTICPDPERLYIEAINDMLSNYASSPWQSNIIEVLKHIGNDFEKLQDLLIEMLRSRDIWLPLVNTQEDIQDVVKHSIEQRTANIIKLLKEHFPQELTLLSSKIFSFYLSTKFIEAPQDILESSNITIWKYFADFILTAQNTVRKRANKDIGIPAASSANNKEEKEKLKLLKEEAIELFTHMQESKHFISLLIMLKHVPNTLYSESEWNALKNIMSIMPIAAAYLNITFERNAQCDFIAVNLAAMEALGTVSSPSDIAINFSSNIRHILVDEFQDTSLSQLDMLKKLTISWENDGQKSLFLVGDPMQSIYKFRQADVAIFLSLINNNLGNIKLHHLSLTTNFRSASNIVNWVNNLFEKLFIKDSLPDSGQVNFTRASSYHNDKVGKVEFNIAIETDQNELIAKKTQQILKSKESIAILVRSRSHLQDLSSALDEYNIPYIQEDIIPLVKSQAATDIAHLYLALNDLGNKISWISLLASPLCGLKYKSIHMLAGKAKNITIWEAIHQDITLPEDELFRLKYFSSIIEKLMQSRDINNQAMWLESAWLSLGGPSFLNKDSEANSISKLFHSLFELANNIPQTWPGWQKLLSRQYIATDSANISKVVIMTIHKAKGLEFDHVFLMSFEKSPPAHRSSLLNWSLGITEANNLVISPIASDSSNKSDINNYLNYIAKLQNINEDIRVLYVAATRAKKCLYIYANAKEDNNEIKLSNNNSFMSLTWEHLKNNTHYFRDDNSKRVMQNNQDQKIINLEHLKNTSLSISENPYNFIEVFKSDTYHTIRGTLIHKYLEKMANMNIDIKEIKIDKLTSNLEADIKERLANTKLFYAMKNEIISILESFINTPFAVWIMSPEHKMCQNEYAITVRQREAIKNIVIDRTFIDNDNNRWIIDYKSIRENPENFEEFSAEQKCKHYNQLSNYAQAFREENRNIICCLYFLPLQRYLTFNMG